MDSVEEKWMASNFETTTLTHPRLFSKQKQRGLRLCWQIGASWHLCFMKNSIISKLQTLESKI